MNDIPTSEVLNRAADLIEERGWTQGDGWFPEMLPVAAPLCAEGAMKAAAAEVCAAAGDALARYTVHREQILPAFKDYLGVAHVFVWNDAGRRTASEVIEALRACAVIEASREREAAEVSA